MAKPSKIAVFKPTPGDPLAAEHAAINRWIQEADDLVGVDVWRNIQMRSLDSGRVLLDAGPEQTRKYLLAALTQAQYWDERMVRLRASARNDFERANIHRGPDWSGLWTPQRHAVAAIRDLLRRSLPLEETDLLSLLTWCNGQHQLSSYLTPVAQITKTLQRHVTARDPGSTLRDAMREFALRLRASYEPKTKRLGTVVEQFCEPPVGDAATDLTDTLPPPDAAPVGNALVFYRLKCLLGAAKPSQDLAEIPIGPDQFGMPEDSPLRREHEQITELLYQITGSPDYHSPNLNTFSGGRAILALDPVSRGKVFLAAAERHTDALLAPALSDNDARHWRAPDAVAGIAQALAHTRVELDDEGLFDFLLYLSTRPAQRQISEEAFDAITSSLEQSASQGGSLSQGQRFVLHLWRGSRITGPPLGARPSDIARLTNLIGDRATFYLVPGERWSDAINADISRLGTSTRAAWVALLKHLLTATSTRPSGLWLKRATKLVEAVGTDSLRSLLDHWLPLVAKGRTLRKLAAFAGDTRSGGDSIHDENAMALRGLLWLVRLLPRREGLERLAGSVALSAYKKIPGVGPRAVKVGNAAVYALSEMVSPESIGQLAMLKVRVRFGAAQKEIEKAFDAAAIALELPRDQIEEMSVPSCGLEGVGRRDDTISGYRAELAVTGSDAELKWLDARGKALKSAPVAVRRDNPEIFRELQQSVKDVQSMLAAQRQRIDALFLERKQWLASVWRERYLDHPLVGTIARRLIWRIGGTPVTVINGQAQDIRGTAVDVRDDAEITLWHPAGLSVDDVVAWRRRIEDLGIVQPFKQAHREVYLLTDAERRTDTYSNRFAAHILRQHQFNSLCGARRWRNKLRLLVDDSYPPASRSLPAWGLRAEFWIEGIGESYGADTNDAGVFLRLASDQVRFYRIGAAVNYAHAGGGGYTSHTTGPGLQDVNDPIPLTEIPPLVFSEIMRDVDLFVGVASIGNDPTWQDGGAAGRFRDYWHTYSFGELNATALTRSEILLRLVPRLKIADRCTLIDRFLVVRGSRRTYKIHLGSGNVLMEPNDQYLCIVPDSHARSNQPETYLPFEGDTTLSIILSKAFLLADDLTINDATINLQIDNK